jgi:F420-non-reducing hydrogenase iron-sulfur subunit
MLVEAQKMGEWQPGITVLACSYCGSVPVEMAGLQQASCPAEVKVLQVACTGTIGTLHLLAALEQGADGVLVVACPEDNCHHLTGNVRAGKRMAQARAVLVEAGLAPERLRLVQLGIGHGRAFAQALAEMTESIRALGPVSARSRVSPREEAS